jgi:hypothetical protein
MPCLNSKLNGADAPKENRPKLGESYLLIYWGNKKYPSWQVCNEVRKHIANFFESRRDKDGFLKKTWKITVKIENAKRK